ncbi:MAG: hypothetical protein ABIJ18_01035 [archaeon]
MKRGQVTIFTVLGLIVIIIVALLLFLNQSKSSIQSEVVELENIDDFENYINSCIYDTLEEAKTTIMRNGGVAELKDYNQEYNVEYYSNLNLENEFSKYMETNLRNCKVQISDYEIEYGDITTEITIENKEIQAEVEWPITITNDIKSELKYFSAGINSNLYIINNFIEEYLNNEQILLQNGEVEVNILADYNTGEKVYIFSYENEQFYIAIE